jgi:hypothetical protein
VGNAFGRYPREAGARQRSSHAGLTCDESGGRSPISPTRSRFDAIVVPTSRGAAALDGAAQLSARIGVPLLVLCSRNTTGAAAAARIARVPGCTGLTVEVPPGYGHELLPTRTSAAGFVTASARRRSDLALKRNLGLLMARLRGWGKILFLDDDIGDPTHGASIGLPVTTALRLAQQLDSHQITGMACRDFPDNSVVCHARRLVGLQQDTFVSGAVLGVNVDDQPIPFFPDIYNEDWFFFSRLAAERSLGHAGYATQAPYDPFQETRARTEEFGDLLAEGLFSLFEDQPDEMPYSRRLESADASYWWRFAADRAAGLDELDRVLTLGGAVADPDRRAAAADAIRAAKDQLSTITPGLCADFVRAWAADLNGWEHETQRLRSVRTPAEALAKLGLHQWHEIGANSWSTVVRTAPWSSVAPAPSYRRAAS